MSVHDYVTGQVRGSKRFLQRTLGTLVAVLLMAFSITAHAAEEVITFIHTDHLGSPVLATNEDGSEKWREDYRPYGAQLVNADSGNNVGFTGHKDDKQLGITYMQGRWYHPEFGRFMATDPVLFVEDNVQSFNRYAYANNNPYGYVDPDGRIAKPVMLVLDVIDLGKDLASGNIGGAAITVLTMLEPTGMGSIARRAARAKKALDAAGDVTKGLAGQLNLSGTKQRELLRAAMGSDGSGKIAHHVVPLEAIKRFPELMKKGAQGGFNINGRNNGALLDIADHIGGHPIYNKAVMEQLNRISPNLSPARTARELQKISDTLQNSIRQGTFGPWG